MEEKRKYQQERKGEFAEAFLTKNELPRYVSYDAVSKFSSIRRAIRRGKADLYTGIPFPKRSFSNRKPPSGRKFNELKKQIYGQYLQRAV